MKELNEIVTEKTKEMLSSGLIESMIQSRLEKTIGESIEASMKSYSDFGKAINDKVKDSIGLGRDIDLPSFGGFIATVVQEKFTKVMEENASKLVGELIEADLETIRGPISTSGIQEEVEKHWGDTAREHGKDCIEITSEESDSGEALYVTFNHPEYDWYSIKVTFYKFNKDEFWHIGYLSQDDKRMSHGIDGITHAGHLCQYFYRLYAARVKIDLSDEFYDIDVCGY